MPISIIRSIYSLQPVDIIDSKKPSDKTDHQNPNQQQSQKEPDTHQEKPAEPDEPYHVDTNA